MKYIDEFRDPESADTIYAAISRIAAEIKRPPASIKIMEVCGSHTMSIARYGIRSRLPPCIDLISGPGCPVCVTGAGYIDAAIALADRNNVIVTFGDMLYVPGSESNLAHCRSSGGKVEVCYSPVLAVEIAEKNPCAQVVFLGIGFETTIGPVISIIPDAQRRGISNVSILTAFKTIPPGLNALVSDKELNIDAFLCPAHVSAIIGSNAYAPYAEKFGKPCVVCGFEPLDILVGVLGVMEQIRDGVAKVENRYSRVVKPDGNKRAQECLAKYLEPADAYWRGVGVIHGSALKIRKEFRNYDAAMVHNIDIHTGVEHPGCGCGSVIKGIMKPEQCKMFGKACTPENPIGPCMVSSEGSCAAAFKYAGVWK